MFIGMLSLNAYDNQRLEIYIFLCLLLELAFGHLCYLFGATASPSALGDCFTRW